MGIICVEATMNSVQFLHLPLEGVPSLLEPPPPFAMSDEKYSSSLSRGRGSLLSEDLGEVILSFVPGVLPACRRSSVL